MNKKNAAFILAIIALVGVVYTIGYFTKPTAVSAQTPTPEAAVVTVTTEPVVVEKEVVVNEVPSVCFDALDRADEAFAYVGEAFRVVSEIFNATSNLDLAAMEKGVDKLGGMQEKLGDKLETYKTARDACRANAKG